MAHLLPLVFTFLVLVGICFDLGGWRGISCFFCSVFLLPVGLGGNRKMVALTLGNPATSDRGFYFPVLHTAYLISVCL